MKGSATTFQCQWIVTRHRSRARHIWGLIQGLEQNSDRPRSALDHLHAPAKLLYAPNCTCMTIQTFKHAHAHMYCINTHPPLSLQYLPGPGGDARAPFLRRVCSLERWRSTPIPHFRGSYHIHVREGCMRANANAQVYLRQKSPKCEMFCAIATVQNEKPTPKN